ncbi:hypothetical protein FRC02_004575 [Tulasnella sp. 418]|nr:hypothetical protein FRC02_004575 [Tulasnella sp. 418]
MWHTWATPAIWSADRVSLENLFGVLRGTFSGHRRGIFRKVEDKEDVRLVVPSDVTRDEWERFLYAFSHVKHLVITCLPGVNGAKVMEVLERLQRRYGGEFVPTFQQITGYDWGLPPTFLFSTHLRGVEIEGIPRYGKFGGISRVTLEDYLENVLQNAPHLRNIKISSFYIHFNMASFNSLTKIELKGGISKLTLQSVFQCPRLRSLSFYDCIVAPETSSSTSDHSPIINDTLQEFGMPFWGFAAYPVQDALLRRLSLPALTKLALIRVRNDWENALSLIEGIIPDSPLIKQVSFKARASVPISVLSTLSARRSLVIFKIRSASCTIVHEELKKWLRSTPLLDAFEWEIRSRGRREWNIRIPGLLAFARFSPMLRRLSLHLNVVNLSAQLEELNEDYDHILKGQYRCFPSLQFLKLAFLNLFTADMHNLAQLVVALTPAPIKLEVLVEPFGPGLGETPDERKAREEESRERQRNLLDMIDELRKRND